jgi:hypothetical protein
LCRRIRPKIHPSGNRDILVRGQVFGPLAAHPARADQQRAKKLCHAILLL